MFHPSKVMQDFLHSMNQPWLLTNFYRDDISWYLLNSIFCWIYQPCLLWILWIPTNHYSKPLLWAGYYYLGMVHNQRPGRSQIGKFFFVWTIQWLGYRNLNFEFEKDHERSWKMYGIAICSISQNMGGSHCVSKIALKRQLQNWASLKQIYLEIMPSVLNIYIYIYLILYSI